MTNTELCSRPLMANTVLACDDSEPSRGLVSAGDGDPCLPHPLSPTGTATVVEELL